MPMRRKVSNLLKIGLRNSFAKLGLEVHKRNASRFIGEYPRDSLRGLLLQSNQIGFAPGTVVDVGAAYGAFTCECKKVFPDTAYVLVEPLKEYEEFLKSAVKSLRRGEYVLAAAGKQPGQITINVHPDLVGSSFYLEAEGSTVNGFQREVPVITLDTLVDTDRIRAPVLLKIDVQGAELDVLSGGEKLLSSTEYALIEISLFEFFKGGPQLHDIIEFMKVRGFVAYDISGLQYRPFDNALSQVDLSFVKEGGLFRRHHQYATAEQRERLTRKMAMELTRVAKGLGVK
jgi:FkbM family methyltransferase